MIYRAQSPPSGAVHRMKGNERKPHNLAQGSRKEQTRTPANMGRLLGEGGAVAGFIGYMNKYHEGRAIQNDQSHGRLVWFLMTEDSS